MSGNSYVKYDQRFLYYLGLLITKKVILNSIVGVSLNEYNKRHTVVVAEKSVLKSVSIGNSCLHGSLVRGFQIGVLA